MKAGFPCDEWVLTGSFVSGLALPDSDLFNLSILEGGLR